MKVPYISPGAFDHFADRFRGLHLIVYCHEFYLYLLGVVYIHLECFLYQFDPDMRRPLRRFERLQFAIQQNLFR